MNEIPNIDLECWKPLLFHFAKMYLGMSFLRNNGVKSKKINMKTDYNYYKEEFLKNAQI